MKMILRERRRSEPAVPKLFDAVVLLVDCEVIGEPAVRSARIMPAGARGVLVDQNTAHPQIWIIEFAEPGPSGPVLVEASQDRFAVCEEQFG